MRRFLKSCLFFLILFTACTPQKKALHMPGEEVRVPGERPGAPKETALRTGPAESGVKEPGRDAVTLQCKEDTPGTFNMSGIDALPFLRVAFHDMDGDGLPDMIAGSKDGLLHLYRNSGHPGKPRWAAEKGYFDGINGGAFSSPAVGDLDGDGEVEIAVGTGGFSSHSGRVLFFRNEGTKSSPLWSEIPGITIKVGNDAAVAVVDYDFDGRPDVITGNSEGRISFFRNITIGGTLQFVKDRSFVKRTFGMYAVPAAVKIADRVLLVIGNDRGRLHMIELKRSEKDISTREMKVKLSSKSFASPSFGDLLEKGRFDLVLADGDGVLSYFENRRYDFASWGENQSLFNNRVYAGPACTPTVCVLRDGISLVVGNIDGTFKLYEFTGDPTGLPWVERKDYLKDVRVPSYSRGILTEWDGREILIVGQGDGGMKAFVNRGTGERSVWKEEKGFFQGISVGRHSTPTVFDIDGDGRWELITGAADGKVYVYGVKEVRAGMPLWERIREGFDAIRVEGFSTPAAARDGNSLYLFVGQEDGKIRTFVSESVNRRPFDYGLVRFREKGYLRDVRMATHSSPSIWVKDGVLEMVSGDYNGNLRYFSCNRVDSVAERSKN